MVASHAVYVDHRWLRVATYVATVVSAGHAMVSSRNRTRNLRSRLVRLWSRVATRCFDSPTPADPSQLYYPMKFKCHAALYGTIH
ncbi:hypothetical protein Hanom_Chr04g00382851 [Helianthus anomalus]